MPLLQLVLCAAAAAAAASAALALEEEVVGTLSPLCGARSCASYDDDDDELPAVNLLQSNAVALQARKGTAEGNLSSNSSVDAAAGAVGCVLGPGHCACVASDPTWVRANRTAPRSVFIDLGAADGNSFAEFKHHISRDGDWEAILVEANPAFTEKLTALEAQYSGRVRALTARPAQACEKTVSFSLDNNAAHNYWGSNIGGGDHRTEDWAHPNDMSRLSHRENRGGPAVALPTVNVVRLIYESTIPGDQVTLKVDIEGAEWDIIPCLAGSAAAALVDELYLEVHPANWQQGCTTPEEMQQALRTLKSLYVAIPKYWSPTL